MIIQPAKRTESVQEYYFSRKLKEIAQMMSGEQMTESALDAARNLIMKD